MKRHIIIGAIGGDKQEKPATDFGEAVARADCILLTGGGNKVSDQVKDASILGAKNAAQKNCVLARFVGILPSDDYRWKQEKTSLLLHTGLEHNIRNVINGVTPDVIVVFGGSLGTLAEAAFALAAGKKLLFFSGQDGGGAARLRRNFEKYFKEDSKHQEYIDLYLSHPLRIFPDAWASTPTQEALLSLLWKTLRVAEDWAGSARGSTGQGFARADRISGATA
jgi:uncharacterized protein (TIGR00725 family)